jgi:hypothetical protein
MAKVGYSSPGVTQTANATDVRAPLDALATQSVNIDSTNLREEGLDRSVFAPQPLCFLASRVEYAGARFTLNATGFGVWTLLTATGPTNIRTPILPLAEGEAFEVRATVHWVSDGGDPAAPWGLGPPTPLGPDVAAADIGIRIAVNHPGAGTFNPLPETERRVGGTFDPIFPAGAGSIPNDNEIRGRHASLCTMAMVPNNASGVVPPFIPGDYVFQVEYDSNIDTFPRQILLYVIKYKRCQELI